MSPGDEVIVQLIREGKVLELTVVLGSVDSALAESKTDSILEGVTLQVLDPQNKTITLSARFY